MKILLLLVLLSPSALARIGETLEQIKQRYGLPIASMNQKQMLPFVKDGLSIAVIFRDGRSVHEFVQAVSTGAKISEGEMDIIRRANGFTSEQSVGSNGKRSWLRADNRVVAMENFLQPMSIDVMDTAYYDKEIRPMVEEIMKQRTSAF